MGWCEFHTRKRCCANFAQGEGGVRISHKLKVLCEFRTSLEQLSSKGHIFLISAPNCWRRKEEILPLFNKEEAQEADKEEIPKLNLKPLPMELKYTPWVSPTQVVPKNSGITVVQNEKAEEIATRLTSVVPFDTYPAGVP
ncbi:hypothetical protein CK203_113669 [Vitis vinifera]|uniref:Uncharacterized protein n=1 Tax=Vitis vinifera TaxID=29760 RepID=A0A438CZ25_VITVI|nr:hypothetical protein CK203_113669 [Vitis vinifera]